MSEQHGYERTDATPKPLIVFALGLAVLIAVTLGAVGWLQGLFAGQAAVRSRTHPMADAREAPSGPLLQAHPTSELVEHRRDEETALGKYDWIDRENGIVQIPIEQALERIVERGLPVREDPGGER